MPLSGTEEMVMYTGAGTIKGTTQDVANLVAGSSTPFKGTFSSTTAANAGVTSPALGDYVIIESSGEYTHVDGTLLTVYTDPSVNGTATDVQRNNMPLYDADADGLAAYPGSGTFVYGVTSDAGVTVQTKATPNGVSSFNLGGTFPTAIAYDPAHIGLLAVPQSNITDPIYTEASYNGTEFKFSEAQLKDGDYGDVSVSGDGKIITVDPDAITVTKIADDAVGTDEIVDSSVTSAKLSDSGATAGSYTLPNITVNEKGQITAITDGSADGSYVGRQDSVTSSSGGTYNTVISSLSLDAGTYRIKGDTNWSTDTVGGTATFAWRFQTSADSTASWAQGSWWSLIPEVKEGFIAESPGSGLLPDSYGSGQFDFETGSALVTGTLYKVYFDFVVNFTDISGIIASLGIVNSGTSGNVQTNVNGFEKPNVTITKLSS